MAFSSGSSSVSLDDILSRVTEADILSFYLGINEVPCIINSPLRQDKRPSFGFYSPDGKKIYYTDLSTKDRGGLYDLLGKLWGKDYKGVLDKIDKDINNISRGSSIKKHQFNIQTIKSHSSSSDLQCKVREWKDYDIEYWKSYGISLEWLKYAEVYPISHKIIIKGDNKFVLGADKYAYAYVEHKEGKVTLKIYQPFNKAGFKWTNKHDNSVISLWTKVPQEGEMICICASLKDALCLWSNTGIPCIAVQGEGYNISNTAINELKKRFARIYILFDNDEAGLADGLKLSKSTGFTNVVLPKFEGGKDVSDLYHVLQDKQKFTNLIKGLFK